MIDKTNIMMYKYYLKHSKTEEIINMIFSYDQIFRGYPKTRFNELSEYAIIRKSKCTGLIPNNGGNDFLFEDDIFEYHKHEGYSLPSFTAVVVWIEESACFGYKIIKTDDDKRFIPPPTPFAEHDELDHDFLPHITIIGNKIENNYNKEPEILDVPKVIEKRLLIKQCNDSLMWYSHKVGQLVAFTRETATEYISIDNGGFVNIVKKKDAVIVDVEVTLKS